MIGEPLAEWIVSGLAAYVGAGLLFALYFVVFGVDRIDPVARESSWGFRVMILPGSIVLWPLLLKRCLLRQTAPPERNAHRAAARSDS